MITRHTKFNSNSGADAHASGSDPGVSPLLDFPVGTGSRVAASRRPGSLQGRAPEGPWAGWLFLLWRGSSASFPVISSKVTIPSRAFPEAFGRRAPHPRSGRTANSIQSASPTVTGSTSRSPSGQCRRQEGQRDFLWPVRWSTRHSLTVPDPTCLRGAYRLPKGTWTF